MAKWFFEPPGPGLKSTEGAQMVPARVVSRTLFCNHHVWTEMSSSGWECESEPATWEGGLFKVPSGT